MLQPMNWLTRCESFATEAEQKCIMRYMTQKVTAAAADNGSSSIKESEKRHADLTAVVYITFCSKFNL